MNLLFLLKSRKFWLAAVTIVSMVLASQGRDELPVEAVADAIAIIVSVLIASIAAEDIGRKMSGGE
jgi:hypothetical protein